jgi:hypothetical protein
MSNTVCYQGVISAKWAINGSTTLEEAASKLRQLSREIEQMSNDGITLRKPIRGGYGLVYTADPAVAEKHGLLLQVNNTQNSDDPPPMSGTKKPPG